MPVSSEMETVTLRQIGGGSAPLHALLDRHAAFWRGTSHDSFLRVTTRNEPALPVGLPQHDGRIVTDADRLTPDMVDPDLLIDQIEHIDLAQPGGVRLLHSHYLAYIGQGDAPPRAYPFSKIPWLEAMLGCPITITSGHIWSAPYRGDVDELAARGANVEQSAWFRLYLEFLQRLQSRLGDRYFVSANTLLRGPCDLVAALLGVQEAAVGWLDDPARMARLLRLCTDANLAVIEAGNRILPRVYGGYMATWDLWAPAPVVATQADHSSLLSARIYGEQIISYDLEVAASRPLSIFHLHNNGLHVAPLLWERPEIAVLEVAVDPYPAGKRRIWEVEMLQRIQEHKPLILNVQFPSYAESEWLLSQLDRRNLYFNARFDPDAADFPETAPGTEHWVLC